MTKKYPIYSWRAVFDIASAWAVIGACIAAVVSVSAWLYPIAAVVIANRALALSLLCHEAVHGNLHRNRTINDWLGRVFCGFPTLMSLSKYRRLHLLHHASVGSEKWDPDRNLYDFFPCSAYRFVARQCLRLCTLQTFFSFLAYYTEFPELLTCKRLPNGKLHVLSGRSDLLGFVFLTFGAISLLWHFDLLAAALVFWFLPMFIFTQPYVLLMGGLQHGPLPKDPSSGASRSVVGSKLSMWFLLPCDINFHAEHHLFPTVPHYHLPQLASELPGLWRCSYRQALQALFPASR